MIREPVVAGRFYPGSPDRLRKIIGGMVDERADKEDVIGVVMPHAGYEYSGTVAGATISRVRSRIPLLSWGRVTPGWGSLSAS